MKTKTLVVATMMMLASVPLVSQTTHNPVNLKYGASHIGKRQDATMNRFRENRLGAFIHWGLYAIPGGVWNGQTYSGAAEWLKSWAGVSTPDWMALMSQWNPQHFDARQWAKMFKNMGARYVKITTKHHDGFCLWPSHYSPYTVAHTPDKRDMIGEMVKAFNDEGIDVHLYFSIMDWSNPDWRYDIKTAEDSIAFERFKAFTENQLRELCTRYPTVRDLWFDGTWDASVRKNGEWTAHLEQMVKSLIPDITVNSRLRTDEYGQRHFDSNGNLMGDYESGYERKLPDPIKDLRVTQWDWEACMTLPENQWGYHRDWSLSYVKTPIEVLEKIVHAVSMGGNMVVNFGPQPDGDFRPEEKHMAQAIGKWMKRNGECIYRCGYANLPKQDWGYFTQHADTTYMVVFNNPISGGLTVKVNKGDEIKEAHTIDGKQLKVTETTASEYRIDTPTSNPREPYVIRLQIAPKGQNKKIYREALT